MTARILQKYELSKGRGSTNSSTVTVYILSLKLNLVHFQYSEEKQLHLKTVFCLLTFCLIEGKSHIFSLCSDYLLNKVGFQQRFRKSGIASLVVKS